MSGCLRHTGGHQSGGRALLGRRKTAGRDHGPWRLDRPLCDLDDGPARRARGGRVMRRARGPIFPVPGSRRGSRWGPREMLHRQRGGATQNEVRGATHPPSIFRCVCSGFAVSVRVFRPMPADPSRASGEGKDGSDPPFFAAGAARLWEGCTTRCYMGCNTFPPRQAGSLPSEIIHAGRLRRPPTGASGRADGRQMTRLLPAPNRPNWCSRRASASRRRGNPYTSKVCAKHRRWG